MRINWNVTRDEHNMIVAIADRALALAQRAGVPYTKTELMMDVTACHTSGCPLDLAALLDADIANFAHDVFGIRRHIDRETGKLGDCFTPRYAARQN